MDDELDSPKLLRPKDKRQSLEVGFNDVVSAEK